MVSSGLRRYFILALAVALLVALYAAAGFWSVPRIVRAQLQHFVTEHYGRQVSVGEVRFNPFTFALEVAHFKLPDTDGQPVLSFARLRIDFDIASLWRRGFSFSEIVLEQPFARVLIRRDGKLNLADLTSPLAGKEPEPKTAASRPTRLFIDRLTVRAGRSMFEDRTRTQPFRAELRPISFELRDFSTTEQTGNAYSLAGASAAGERFNWNGTIRLNPLASQGRFELADVRVRTLWNYLRDSVHFETASGVLGLNGDYAFKAAGPAVGFKLNVHDLTVTNLGLRPKGAVANSIDLSRIEVHETRVDVDRRTVTIGNVWLAEGEIRAWLDTQARLNLLDLAGPPAAPAAAVRVAHDRQKKDEETTEAGWTIAAPDFSLSGLNLFVEDRQVTPAVALAVNDLEARVVGFTTAPDAALDITAAAEINDAGKMNFAAKVAPDSGMVNADLEITQLDLTAIQPYLARHTQLTLRSGLLGTKLHVERAADGALTAEGDTEVNRLHTVDNAYQRDFIKWDRLRVRNLRYRSEPASLQIGSITAQRPYARVIIAKDRSVNIADVLRPPQATPAAEAPSSAAPMKSADAMPISIGAVRIANGSANFADLWIQPNFAVGIQTLNGAITGLSSNPRSRAKVELEGKVDRYAPALIRGEVNLLSAAAYSDLQMSFKSVEMTTATPYSGHFAGYKIEKGKLSVDLNYHVQDRQLKADHRFVIDQLQLGERVESADAVRLPLRLAVALLKDRNGVIDVNLPVTGSLDDPKFRIGPIVWKAVIGLLTKIATAPFALLGRLFGGGAEMNLIDFAPGSASLDAPAQERLAGLRKALQERPQLQLDVPMVSSPDLDGPAIVAQRLQEALLDLKRAEVSRKRASSTPIDATILDDPAEHFRLLVAMHRAQLGKGAPLPATAQALEAAGRKKRAEPATFEPAIAELEAALRAHMPVQTTELEALGKLRAQAIQDALLGSGEIDPARLFVITAPPKPGTGNAVRVEMSLK